MIFGGWRAAIDLKAASPRARSTRGATRSSQSAAASSPHTRRRATASRRISADPFPAEAEGVGWPRDWHPPKRKGILTPHRVQDEASFSAQFLRPFGSHFVRATAAGPFHAYGSRPTWMSGWACALLCLEPGPGYLQVLHGHPRDVPAGLDSKWKASSAGGAEWIQRGFAPGGSYPLPI